MASVLWDSDIEEVSPDFWNSKCDHKPTLTEVQRENETLKAELEKVQKENRLLRIPKPSLPPDLAKPDPLSLWPQHRWLERLGPNVLSCPRLCQEILPELDETKNAKHRITFDLCGSTKASSVLRHSETCVRDLSKKISSCFQSRYNKLSIEKMAASTIRLRLGKGVLVGYENPCCLWHFLQRSLNWKLSN